MIYESLDFEATLFFMLMEGREDFLANTFGKKLFRKYIEDFKNNRIPANVITAIQGNEIIIDRDTGSVSVIQGDKVHLDWGYVPGEEHAGSTSMETPDEIKNLLVKSLINYIMQFDPTSKNKYAQWIVVQYVKGNLLLEDLYKIHDAIEIFEIHKRSIPQKDINQFKTVREFIDKMDELAETEVLSIKVSNFLSNPTTSYFIGKGEAEVFYQSPSLLVIIPKTHEASCYFGKHTKWCTSSEHQGAGAFKSYTSRGNLYIVIASNVGKFQWHFSSRQYMDEKDSHILGRTWFTLLKNHPELVNIGKEMAKREFEQFGYTPNTEDGTYPIALTGNITNDDVKGLISTQRDFSWIAWVDKVTKPIFDKILSKLHIYPDVLGTIENKLTDNQLKRGIRKHPSSFAYLSPKTQKRTDLQNIVIRTLNSTEEFNERTIRDHVSRIFLRGENFSEGFLNSLIKYSSVPFCING